MVNSLSPRLNLRVNGYQIILDDKLKESELRQHNIEKAGFFQRLIMRNKISGDKVVFWSKNCELKYLNEDFENIIIPILDAESGADIMYGTTAYLFYKKNILSKFCFQIIQNKPVAKMLLGDFEKRVIEIIGNCTSSDELFKTWEVENHKLVLEYPHHNIPHGYIFFMRSE